MSRIFSPRFKFETWRRLWVLLAEEEQRLGLPISDEAIGQMRAAVAQIDFSAAAEKEHALRHDVMAHVRVFGDAAPAARGIIHWGATSAYVADNTDLVQMREALALLEQRLVHLLRGLARFARAHRDLPAVAFTHFQPAQPTTVGKRACLWAYDLLLDLREIRRRGSELAFLGAKGATGTQASFLQLFGGDASKVEDLDRRIAERAGFARRQIVSGQTYTRKQDAFVLGALSGLGQSAHKMGTDLRLLQHEGEIEEPSEAMQVGSSAMPHKKNPMRAERVCAVARHLIVLGLDPAFTAATQWLERTLDDSANKRLSVPEAFLAADAVLLLLSNIVEGLIVHPETIRRHLEEQLPYLATESILMEAVRRGKDRQELHERIRRHAWAAAERTRAEGGRTDLLERLSADPEIGLTRSDLAALARPENFTGCSSEQVDTFLREELEPALAGARSAEPAEIRV
jgi:adenylosuccinate lyase